ncbi:hypothetical protein [Pseudomonas sp. TWI929]|uniref:hypothetical protein n=1 Tax=Pseudomonas sp. TWI929 TaxID=3136795 RepID=UPI00320A4B4C
MKRTLLAAMLSIASIAANAEDAPRHHNFNFRVHGLGNEKCPTILSVSASDQIRLNDYARGFITGVNVFSKVARVNPYSPKKTVGDLEGDIPMIDEGVRNAFVRNWCVTHPSDDYQQALTAWVEHIINTSPPW